VTEKITQMLEYIRNREENKLKRGFSEQNKNVNKINGGYNYKSV